jgi:hypothetical protein
MIPIIFRDFINRLLAETESDSIRWQEVGDLSYTCARNEVKVFVSRHWDEDRSEGWFSFRVITLDGDSVPFFVREADGEDFHFIERVFQAVIANASNVGVSLQRFFGPGP